MAIKQTRNPNNKIVEWPLYLPARKQRGNTSVHNSSQNFYTPISTTFLWRSHPRPIYYRAFQSKSHHQTTLLFDPALLRRRPPSLSIKKPRCKESNDVAKNLRKIIIAPVIVITALSFYFRKPTSPQRQLLTCGALVYKKTTTCNCAHIHTNKKKRANEFNHSALVLCFVAIKRYSGSRKSSSHYCSTWESIILQG